MIVVPPIRVSNTTGLEQRGRLRGCVGVLAIQDAREMLLVLRICLWVRREAAGRVIIEAISMQMIWCWAEVRRRGPAGLNLVVDSQEEQDALHDGRHEKDAP